MTTLSQDFRARTRADHEARVEVEFAPARSDAVSKSVSGNSSFEQQMATRKAFDQSFGKLWANGSQYPKDRPGLVASLHPALYMGEELLADLAAATKRDCWVIRTPEGWTIWGFMLGDSPPYNPDDSYCGIIRADGNCEIVGMS